MLGFFKKKSAQKNITASAQKLSLKDKLIKTKNQLSNHLAKTLLGKEIISDTLLDEIETILLQADIGINTCEAVIKSLKKEAKFISGNTQQDLYQLLQQILADLLISANALDLTKPLILLIVGVNGAGKTTTIGKLAKQFQAVNKSVMLAAADTFRAAAVEQLKIWGARNNITVISGKENADSAAVAYDGLQLAKQQQIDVLIVDTAGRLHTQQNLMAELAKVKRILTKHQAGANLETMLVVDGNTGGNALFQAKEFKQKISLDSIAITKLDGSAKGGVLFSICEQLQLPIRYIGVGEGIDDLKTFNKTEFIKAIF